MSSFGGICDKRLGEKQVLGLVFERGMQKSLLDSESSMERKPETSYRA